MAYKDPDKQREYQRLRVARRRQEWINQNGPCVKCGSWIDLEIDHIDPSLKTYNVSQIWSRKQEIVDSELAECQVLCSTHHQEKTTSEQTTKQHRTYAMRNQHGCKCDICKEYVRKSKQAWRIKQRVLA